MRTLSEQVTYLCGARGIGKKRLAAALGITPVYLSQMLRRGMDRDRLEALAKILGVEPFEIDEYVRVRAADVVETDEGVLRLVRSRIAGLGTTPLPPTPQRRIHRRVPEGALWVTPTQAAFLLNVSRTILYEMMDGGELRWSRMRGRRGRRIEIAEIHRLVAQSRK